MRLRIVDAAALLVLTLAAPAFAEDDAVPPAKIPTLPQRATSAEGFAPAGWIVEAKAVGDVDRNGREDVAFVLRGADPALILRQDGREPLDTNPRILGVAVSHVDGGYALAAHNATLIPRHVEQNLDDPFGGLSIKRGETVVALSSFATAGGWDSATVTFTLRLRDSALRAIGFDRTDIKRNTGEMVTTSVNYLTGRKSVAVGTISDDAEKKTWSRVPTPGPAIEEIGDGLLFGVAR